MSLSLTCDDCGRSAIAEEGPPPSWFVVHGGSPDVSREDGARASHLCSSACLAGWARRRPSREVSDSGVLAEPVEPASPNGAAAHSSEAAQESGRAARKQSKGIRQLLAERAGPAFRLRPLDDDRS